MSEALGIAKQRLGVGEKVVSDRDRLRTLKVRVTRHRPPGMPAGLRAQRLDHRGDLHGQLAGRRPAVEAKVERDLVVPRPACMQRRTGGRDLGEPAFDCGVDVLVGVEELELAGIELFADASQSPLDRGQLCGGDDAGGSQAACVRDAAGDVEGVQLEICVQRRREPLELDQQAPLEAAAP